MRSDYEPPSSMLRWVQEVTGARSVERGEKLQTLWGGYGAIVRVRLEGGPAPTVIVKQVRPPRGAEGDRSHQRKLRSYDVERAWYRGWSARCGARVPVCYGTRRDEDGWLFALEDLDHAGFSERRREPSSPEVEACLRWLAALHARLLGETPRGLWPAGTYWHLGTRPDELAAMAPGPLRDAAAAIDRALANATHRTVVHGDAKLANFCFGAGPAVAAVDFQYAGGGVGIQDVVYLLSGLGSRWCERHAEDALDVYFAALRASLAPDTGAAVEAEWRALYPVAWADWLRFLSGWAPAYAHDEDYGRSLTERALELLRRGSIRAQ